MKINILIYEPQYRLYVFQSNSVIGPELSQCTHHPTAGIITHQIFIIPSHILH